MYLVCILVPGTLLGADVLAAPFSKFVEEARPNKIINVYTRKYTTAVHTNHTSFNVPAGASHVYLSQRGVVQIVLRVPNGCCSGILPHLLVLGIRQLGCVVRAEAPWLRGQQTSWASSDAEQLLETREPGTTTAEQLPNVRPSGACTLGNAHTTKKGYEEQSTSSTRTRQKKRRSRYVRTRTNNINSGNP